MLSCYLFYSTLHLIFFDFLSEHSLFLFSFPFSFSLLLFLLLGCGICMVHIVLLRQNILITLVHLFLLAFRPCFCRVTDHHAIALGTVPSPVLRVG